MYIAVMQRGNEVTVPTNIVGICAITVLLFIGMMIHVVPVKLRATTIYYK